MELVEVDGSRGEGGGQILRTAMAFAAIRRLPVRVVKIRGGREIPGLKRQHVAALKVLGSVFGGDMSGAYEGSSTVTFVPERPWLQSFAIDMGTAASITLVLQAVVPAIALSGSRLRLDLVGGTDVPWSPTLDYFQHVAAEGYRSIGIRTEVSASRRGYYPRGGGRVSASIEPCKSVVPIDATSRPRVSQARVVSRCGNLPRRVAERQASSASAILDRSGIDVESVEVSDEPTDSPGSSILVHRTGPSTLIGSDALGERGKPAEEVGKKAAAGFVSAAGSEACYDAHLADMIIPILSLASTPSRVRVPDVTPHLISGLGLAEQFTSCTWKADREGRSVVISIFPNEAR